jgi:hypothetical protein
VCGTEEAGLPTASGAAVAAAAIAAVSWGACVGRWKGSVARRAVPDGAAVICDGPTGQTVSVVEGMKSALVGS